MWFSTSRLSHLEIPPPSLLATCGFLPRPDEAAWAAAACLPGNLQQALLFSAESPLLRAVSLAGTVTGKYLETPLGHISKELGEDNPFAFSDFTLPQEEEEEGRSVKMGSWS